MKFIVIALVVVVATATAMPTTEWKEERALLQQKGGLFASLSPSLLSLLTPQGRAAVLARPKSAADPAPPAYPPQFDVYTIYEVTDKITNEAFTAQGTFSFDYLGNQDFVWRINQVVSPSSSSLPGETDPIFSQSILRHRHDDIEHVYAQPYEGDLSCHVQPPDDSDGNDVVFAGVTFVNSILCNLYIEFAPDNKTTITAVDVFTAKPYLVVADSPSSSAVLVYPIKSYHIGPLDDGTLVVPPHLTCPFSSLSSPSSSSSSSFHKREREGGAAARVAAAAAALAGSVARHVRV